MTIIVKMDPNNPDIEKLKDVAKIAKNGGLVAFPTETVYGLGTNALNEQAVKRLFKVKQRPPDNPVSILISNFGMIGTLAEINNIAKKLIDEFFPGPITIIMKKKKIVPSIVTANTDKVAIRMPDHKIALKIVELAETPLATPSANLSGKPSPTKAEHVIEDFMGKIDVVVDGGKTGIGIESTVVDTTTQPVRIVRLGAIPVEDIESIVGKVEVIDAPSMKHPHYKPNAKLIVVFGKDAIEKIQELARKFKESNLRVGVAVKYANSDIDCDELVEMGDIREYGRKLFNVLREFDKEGIDVIIIEGVSGKGLARSIEYRLKKAADEVIFL